MTATAADPRVYEFLPPPAGPGRRLSEAQVAAYARDGWIAPLAIFAPEEAAANRARFDRLLAMFHAAGRNSYAISGFEGSCESIHRLAAEPRIHDCVEDVLGPDFVCWGTHCFCKLPGDDRTVAWHQDAPFWGFTPTRTVTVWLAIDDVDDGNGAMRVASGSHRHGRLELRDSRADEASVLSLTSDAWRGFAEPTTVALRAGEISIHSDLLLHGSERNRSTRRRCGLAIRYCRTEVRTTSGERHDAIACRGRDPAGWWRERPRPDGDRPDYAKAWG